MTIDEMRRELWKYCGEFDLCGDGCRLRNPNNGSCRWDDFSDESAEDCYHFLIAEGLIGKPEQPEINSVKVERNDEVDGKNDKIKTPIARIIIGGSAAKPYYSIQYFDPTDKEFHIGFSSYALNYVQEWLCENFEIVNEPTCIPYISPEDRVNQNDELEPTNDAVQHPSHYTQGGIECIEAIKASMTADGFCDYCKGNIIKYIWRWRDKGGAEDLRKASVYLNWLINAAEGKRKED